MHSIVVDDTYNFVFVLFKLDSHFAFPLFILILEIVYFGLDDLHGEVRDLRIFRIVWQHVGVVGVAHLAIVVDLAGCSFSVHALEIRLLCFLLVI